MYGGTAMNLAAAIGKIPVTAITLRFLIIEASVVHEVDRLSSLLRELTLISANILTESNVVLFEEIMIIQGRAVFKAMLPSTHNTMLRICSIWVVSDCMYHSMITIKSKHVVWSLFSIGNFNL